MTENGFLIYYGILIVVAVGLAYAAHKNNKK